MICEKFMLVGGGEVLVVVDGGMVGGGTVKSGMVKSGKPGISGTVKVGIVVGGGV